MMRQPFPGHRRYSITHRAVQRLRELIPSRDDEDDESLRDRLDEALGSAEDDGKAIRTLDAMLGEPQTLVPVDSFGDLLYAIIKEETVVTVLPQGHGQEILQRGQAMEQRVAAGQAPVARSSSHAPAKTEDAWEGNQRRRWRKDPHQPVIIQRLARNPPSRTEPDSMHAYSSDPLGEESSEPALGAEPLAPAPGSQLNGPVAHELQQALQLGRRRAVIVALSEVLSGSDRSDSLLPLWNTLANQGIPQTMTVGDLIDAVRQVEADRSR